MNSTGSEDIFFSLAMEHHRSGRLNEAEQLCRQLLVMSPSHLGALQMLAMLTSDSDRTAEAMELLRRALSIKPDSAELHYNLGKSLVAVGRAAEAISHYRRAIVLRPSFAMAWNNLGNALASQGAVDDAIAAYRQSLSLRPDDAKLRYNLGTALLKNTKYAEAVVELRAAISLKADYSAAYNSLGLAFAGAGQLDDAIDAYERGLTSAPTDLALNSNLGSALRDVGRLDDAIAAFRQAIAYHADARAAGNVLYSLLHHSVYDMPSLWEEHRQWNLTYARPLASEIKPHHNVLDPNRRLRIGFVSPHFRDQWFLRPLLANLDHGQFEIFCYDDGGPRDPFVRLEDYADRWQLTRSLSDAQMAEQIRLDQIDVLIDLALHTNGNRLLVFARKPAPVQLTWLGYPGTSGMDAMDYRISDPCLDPPSSDGGPGPNDRFYSEATIRLPDCFWCYDPLTDKPEVNQLPALSNGFVTFGSLNNFAKVTDFTLKMWARVLKSVPTSRLHLLAPRGATQGRMRRRFAQADIDPSRIGFINRKPRSGYLGSFHEIDITLDVFPYTGHTTTIESLWMGVPVVSLYGQTAVSRGSMSILANVGLGGLASGSPQDCLKVVMSLSKNLEALSLMRSTLRNRLERSPVMDAPRFTANMQAALRKMWRHYCEKR